ncbi:MAG: hypothetical protein QOC81_1442 [Thermoanaerobaculia bacterium]|jgi:hypothetical protein|nr:hypothetical protein [Thermoanaerobaculia bacterium]
MSKRLHVILDAGEIEDIRAIARRKRMTVADWVRAAMAEELGVVRQRKLRALRAATAHSFPTADIEEMLAQIGKG